MIRVAHILPFMGVGGTEQMVLNLCKFSNSNEFRNAVAAPEESVIAEEIRETGSQVYTGWDGYQAVMRWADIINLHSTGYEPNLFGMVESSGKPYVVTLHWLSEMPKIPAITICTSKPVYDIQKDKSKSRLIPNGIDLSKFYPRPKQPRNEIIITRVCRTPKCALYFWAAIMKVLRDYPQTKLWVVGNEKDFGISSDRIIFFGIRRDIPDILADTDIFAYAPYPDTGSKDLAVMEALAMGIPCVVSDVSAVKDSVYNEQNGFLVKFGDEENFSNKVGILVEDSNLRSSMGQSAVEIAIRDFDISKYVKDYENVYREIIEGYPTVV